MKTSPEYEQFARQYTPALLRSAYLLTGEQTAANVLVRAALAHARRDWRSHRKGSPEEYARQSLYRRFVSPWHRLRLPEDPPGYGLDAPQPGVPHDAPAAALRASVRMAMHGLTPTQRAVVVLCWFDGYSDADAARVLGRPSRQVGTQAAALRERLRRIVPELERDADRLSAALYGIAADAAPPPAKGPAPVETVIQVAPALAAQAGSSTVSIT